MTPHDHTTIVPGCYRCELGQDEARDAERAGLAEALDYTATWFALEMVANDMRLDGFNPPAELVDRVAAEMVCQPKLGWPDEDTARFTLSELWPDCEELQDA